MAVQIARHQMWRDELHAWGLALGSPTLPALFQHLHYEGHPGLWHLLLWGVSWFWPAPTAMKAMHAIIAACFILLIALRAPFSRLEKVLVLLNYYLVFEYSVISRNYGIALLLALIHVELRNRRPDRRILDAVVLGLLANTNVYATILSGVLACEMAFDSVAAPREAWSQKLRRLAPAAIVYLAFVALCAATIKPAADISFQTSEYPLVHAAQIGRFLHVLFHYLGIGMVEPMYWLNLLPPTQALVIGLMLTVVVWGLVVWTFRRDRGSFLIVVATAIGAVAFGQLVYVGWRRHWAIVFVAFLVALWMMQRKSGRQPGWAALTLLAIGAMGGVAAVAHEAVHPFSMAGATAEWLRANEAADVALIGSPDMSVEGVALYLGRPMHFLDCSCTGWFMQYNNSRDSYQIEQLPERLALALRSIATGPAVLIVTMPLSTDQLASIAALGIRVRQSATFTGADDPDENFAVYDVADGTKP